jgi:hypothetical protein
MLWIRLMQESGEGRVWYSVTVAPFGAKRGLLPLSGAKQKKPVAVLALRSECGGWCNELITQLRSCPLIT